MLDEFSDELDGANDGGNDGNNRNTGRGPDTGNNTGNAGDYWNDSAAIGSRKSNSDVGRKTADSGTTGGGSERTRGRKSARTRSDTERTSDVADATGASGNTDRTGSAANGTGDDRHANGDDGSAETEPRQRATADDFWIEGQPKRVRYGELGKEKRRTSDKFDSEILKLGVEFCFSAPTFLLPPGTADHWPLTEPEADELAKRLQTLLAALPAKKKSRMMKLLESYGPWILFAVSTSLITYPRIVMTRRLLAQTRANNASQSETPTAPTGFRRYPDFGRAQTGNTTPSGDNGSTNGASGNRRTGGASFNANPQDY